MTEDVLAQVRRELADLYTPEDIEIWLTRPNPMLSGRNAIELIDDGEGELVLTAVEHLTTGAFG
jgi:uncharacterized protein (DUF2384 family)